MAEGGGRFDGVVDSVKAGLATAAVVAGGLANPSGAGLQQGGQNWGPAGSIAAGTAQMADAEAAAEEQRDQTDDAVEAGVDMNVAEDLTPGEYGDAEGWLSGNQEADDGEAGWLSDGAPDGLDGASDSMADGADADGGTDGGGMDGGAGGFG